MGAAKGVPVGTAAEKEEALPVGFAKTIRNQAGQFMTERPRRRWVAAALTVGGVGLGFFALGLWGAVGAAVLAGLGWLVQETVYT